MKLNKSKNKGKVHPSPSFSSLSSTNSNNNPVSNLNNLLPTAILTLISILSLQDKEVLAYMITHNNNSNKKVTFTTTNNGKRTTHKIPSFDCCCFDCYTSYWFRWDSSPNQELIHQAIDAFEEHLTNSEQQKVTPKSSRNKNNKVKKFDQSSSLFTPGIENEVKLDSPEILEVGSPENEVIEDSPVKVVDDVAVEDNNKKVVVHQQQQHKGFARKVLPDVIGLFNSRLWNLWGPNV